MAQQLDVWVKPRSSRNALEQQVDGHWVAWLQAPPVDGKANAALIRLVARHFGVARSSVQLAAGERGRRKRILICD